mmetsp:Transcript_2511/g.4196  ORF Transcript_2511/g.4196 Transcript_2511/m.4196 type:complete len:191 (+) Transcript_2511:194-766(+)|eukprot:CAMPEP_0198219616 /NCGR_PEP_ID=MMETSP1445-20131203/75265_1 /TAXON_ID=36898 /ORGANISM="Pyramimonas sp., Strain CCMP2087" /LENGTH=190 /DNA_ID=CAMNT_0043897079 /DNA_START=187 /DNA_END=759 /DNA_ORIENTATION=+
MAEPLEVEYHPVSGIPPEYCEYSTKAEFEKDISWLLENRDTAWLTANCKNFKEYFQDEKSTEVEEKLKELAVTEGQPKVGDVIAKLPGGKVKKKSKSEVTIERNVRNKRKCITTVRGLENFNIKLADASKLFGKKFACGASVVKGPADKDQIDIQGDFQDDLVEFILEKFKEVAKDNLYFLEKERRTPAC